MKKIIITICITLSFFMIGCIKTSVDNDFGIDPSSEPDLLVKSFVVNGKLKKGQFPTATNTGVAPYLSGVPNAIEVSAGVLLQLPFTVLNASGTPCKIYIGVQNANSYWEIPYSSTNNSSMAELFIPIYVQNGNYQLLLAIADCNGVISVISPVNTLLTGIVGCSSGRISGSYGVTVRAFDMGEDAGKVNVNYQMYSIPDRLDVRQGNKWLTCTGTQLVDNLTPNCWVTDGFVSGTGTLQFDYEPKAGRFVSLYITGCDTGTAWDVDISCPQ